MIHRKFNNLKFSRTYIGGSRLSELNAFTMVQGTKEDNSECNWFEYRRMLKQYLDDKLNILLSWRYILHIMAIVVAIIALVVSFGNTFLGVVAILFSILFALLSKFLRNKEQILLAQYDFSLDIINRETGVNLNKN